MAEIDYNQYAEGFNEYLKQNPVTGPVGKAVEIHPGGFRTNNTGETAAFYNYLNSIGAPIPEKKLVQFLPQPEKRQAVQTVSQSTNIKEKLQRQAGLSGEQTTLPQGTQITPAKISMEGTEVVAPEALETREVVAEQAALTPEVSKIEEASQKAAASYTAAKGEDAPTIDAAQLRQAEVSAPVTVDAASVISQSGVSEGAIAEAAQITQETFDRKATTKYQLEELFKSLDNAEDPSQLPPWAGPAYRAVNAQMAARGLGSSSMASAAMMTAIYESGIPIAKADADAYQAVQISNLNNRQAAVLQNAMMFAAMDKAELDARMNAALSNARSFLSIDLQNLTNQQKTNEIEYQGTIQKMFTDQAAENAARQFNAESQTQVDQFYEQLNASIETGNANRTAANEQFNVNEANAMTQYAENLNNQREQFNANMEAQISQANAAWRRQANTADTQADNEANRINAQNLLNLTVQAQDRLWMEYRDTIQWAMQTAENTADRNHQMAVAAMELDGNVDLYQQQMMYDTAQSVGGFVFDLVFGSDATFSGIFGGDDEPSTPTN